MVVEFECRTRLPVGVDEAFDAARSIDLHLSVWHFGVPITMTSRITRMSPPRLFVDEQVRGPFRSFHHEHRSSPTVQPTDRTAARPS
jgi:ligand-binding SRPBCC domain-containing protein